MIEHECPRCGREVELPFGALCRPCRDDIERRARRIARLVAVVSTVVLAAYVMLRVPPLPTPRLVAALGIVAWYLLTGVVVRRLLRETLK